MITVVGITGNTLTPGATAAVAEADLVVGGARLVAAASTVAPAASVCLAGDLGPALVAVDAAIERGERVCVLASGDPGWFGIVRSLAARYGRDALTVMPAPSSVSEAFARLAMPWDDAAVVSAHGRPLRDAARLAARCAKVAVLTSPDATPSALGAELVALGATHEHVAVCTNLGVDDECVCVTDLEGLADGAWDPLAVVVLWSGSGVADAKSLAWGLPESAFAHRQSMVTKAEVRAVVLGLLALPGPSIPAPVVWDVGAGSGSVIIECARTAPWLEAIAVERSSAAALTCRDNARVHDVAIRIINDEAPACFDGLPDPSRVFVGGGGLAVLTAARSRLAEGGIIVATHAAMDRAAAAADLLGELVQVSASRGRQLPDGGWRLEAANPVFVTWGRAS